MFRLLYLEVEYGAALQGGIIQLARMNGVNDGTGVLQRYALSDAVPERHEMQH